MEAKQRKRVEQSIGDAALIVNDVAAKEAPTEGEIMAAFVCLGAVVNDLRFLAMRDPEVIDSFVLVAGWMRNLRDRQPVEWAEGDGKWPG